MVKLVTRRRGVWPAEAQWLPSRRGCPAHWRRCWPGCRGSCVRVGRLWLLPKGPRESQEEQEAQLTGQEPLREFAHERARWTACWRGLYSGGDARTRAAVKTVARRHYPDFDLSLLTSSEDAP